MKSGFWRTVAAVYEGVNELESGAVVPSLHHRKETSELLSQRHFFGCWKFSRQRGTAQFKTFAVQSFVVGRSSFPAAKDDAYPFKGESAESRMMRFSTLPLLVVIGPSPIRLKDRTAGKLLEGLPQEFGTGQAPMNPNAGTAFFGDRSDAGELLHFSGEFKAAAVGAESGQQTRSQRRTGTRKAAKQGRVTMLIEQRSDLLIVAFNGFAQQRDL